MFRFGQYECNSSSHQRAAPNVTPGCSFLGAEGGIIGVEAHLITSVIRAMGSSGIFLGVRPKHKKGPNTDANNTQCRDPNANILLSEKAAF